MVKPTILPRPALSRAPEALPCLGRRPGEPGPSCRTCAAAACPLAGRRVVIIGGLDRLRPAYCQLVERLGGQCLHHTGQVRGGVQRLRRVVAQADLVVFITTLNSHSALGAVKDACRRSAAPFRALRESGVSSLERALRGLAD